MLITTKFSRPDWVSTRSENELYMWCGHVSDAAPSIPENDDEALSARLKTLTGFYSFIRETPTLFIAAVDHIRSIPLFYGKVDGALFVSDDAEWVRLKVGDKEMDVLAKEEFQLAGYVTGFATLFPNVKQLQAGEYLRVETKDDALHVEVVKYFCFSHVEPASYDAASLQSRFYKVTKSAIERLISYAGGRQIVVPLSGGYDSRLIASVLKELDYDDILTFTYGAKESKEVLYSKKVADALGLRWVQVEYSDELWRKAWDTEERQQYQKWASGWSSIAHLQDWLAVKIMKSQSIVNDDCVFAPGHCCVTGFLPESVFGAHRNKSLMSPRALAESLRDIHFSLVNNPDSNRVFQDKIIPRLASEYSLGVALEPERFANEFMRYGWQERQAKFIGNSVRVYEAFDYDWWMPLWDMEFVEFWQGMPLELMEKREWYKNCVQTIFLRNTDDGSLVNMGNASESGRIKQLVKWMIGSNVKLKSSLVAISNTFIRPSDDMARSGRYDKKLFDELWRKGYGYLGITVYVFIKEIGL